MTEYVGMYAVTVKSFEEMKEDRNRYKAAADALWSVLWSSTDEKSKQLAHELYELAVKNEQ